MESDKRGNFYYTQATMIDLEKYYLKLVMHWWQWILYIIVYALVYALGEKEKGNDS